MPTHINLRYQELDDIWPEVERLQNLADAYGIKDIFQDAGGKMLQLVIACGLDIVVGRTGPDAMDRIGNFYEIKTIDLAGKATGFSTNHHLNHDTIARFRNRRFVFAIYDRITLMEAYLVEAIDLEPLFERWTQVLDTKDHINNPKIPVDWVREVGTTMYLKDVPPAWAINDVKALEGRNAA